MRIGTVQADPAPQADYVWVLVDGTVVQASYFTNYVPIPGDRVTITQDGTDWFVLGGKSGYAGNLVVNGDFSVFPQALPLGTDLPPWNWYHYQASGPGFVTTGLSSITSYRPAMGIADNSATASDNYAYSAAFPVTAGRTYTFDSGVQVQSAGATLTATLRVAWLVVATDTYPTFISESVIGTVTTAVFNPNSAWLSGTAVAPVGATYARVAIRAVMNAGGSLSTTTVNYASARPL